VGQIIIVTLVWSEIMGSYNTLDTVLRDRHDRTKVGHEIKTPTTGTNPSYRLNFLPTHIARVGTILVRNVTFVDI